MAMPVARMAEFNMETDDFIEYSERFDNFLTANQITEETLTKSTFIATIGGPAYKLLRSLSQNDTKSKTYAQLTKLMTDHLSPKPNEIATRFTFYKRDRKSGESVNEYIAELRRLSENCNFGDSLDTYLRDRFVCGLNSESVQQKLLTMKDVTLNSALDTARTYEKAYKDARAIRGGLVEEPIHKLGSNTGKSVEGDRKECFRCGSQYHLANNCSFSNSECYNCGKTGHTRKKCRNGKKSSSGSDKKGTAGIKELSTEEGLIPCQRGRQSSSRSGELEGEVDFLSIYKLAKEKESLMNDPLMVDVEVNGKPLRMDVDTGAAVSVMGVSAFQRLSEHGLKSLEKSGLTLKTYTGELVKPEGVGKVDVCYEGQKCQLPVTVVDGNVPTLLGRDWLSKLKLHWDELVSRSREGRVMSLTDGRVGALVKDYPEVFSDKLGCLKDFKVSIPVKPDVAPTFCKARPVPYSMRSRVEEELDKLEEQGVWKKVTYSKWAAPIVTVLKDAKDPTGPIRICGDYKVAVNKAAPLDSYPIPNTVDQLATLSGGEKFTKLDLSQAYQQLELDEASKELLTINTHRGLYQPNRLQFGVHSATGIFQREMDHRLSRIPFVKVRIDDILVSGRNDVEHLANLKAVLQALKDAGLTLKMPKCAFMQPVTYCGYIVSKDGVKPMTQNVEAVYNAPSPTNITELRSFLGMVNYYNAYLKDLTVQSDPLHKLLRKDVKWAWTKDCQRAFEDIKQALCKAPLLVHFDPKKPILVHGDASPYGVGAVLSHVMEDGSERPVCYASRTLSVAERNYGHVEKEGLALVYAVKKFHQFLFGFRFLMFTDHKPLLGLFSETSSLPARAAARVLRWAILLSGYNYELKYRPGEANGNADALSRLPLDARNGEVSQKVVSVAMMELVKAPVTEKEVRDQSRVDPVLSLVIRLVLEGRSKVDCENESLKPFLSRLSEFTSEGGCLLWGDRVVIPNSLRKKVLLELHEVHPGASRMKSLARSYVWWPNMDVEIEYLVKDCAVCQQNQRNPSKSPAHHWEYPTSPWERIHVDHAGPINGKNFLVVVDSHSKWIEADLVKSTDSKSAIAVLRRHFATHGLPRVLVSDNGTGFSSQEFTEFLKSNGVKHLFSAPYHPSSNGQAERTVRTLKEALKSLKEGDTEAQLCRFLFKYRITPQTMTGVSPADLLVGRRLRSALSLLKPDLVSSMREKQLGASESKKCRSFEIDQPVLIKNYGIGAEWIPGVVAAITGNVNYKVLTTDGRLLHRHVDQVVSRSSIVVQPELSVLPSMANSNLIQPPSNVSDGEVTRDSSVITDDIGSDSSAEKVDGNALNESDATVSEVSSDNVSHSATAVGRPVRERRKPVRFRDDQ